MRIRRIKLIECEYINYKFVKFVSFAKFALKKKRFRVNCYIVSFFYSMVSASPPDNPSIYLFLTNHNKKT